MTGLVSRVATVGSVRNPPGLFFRDAPGLYPPFRVYPPPPDLLESEACRGNNILD